MLTGDVCKSGAMRRATPCVRYAIRWNSIFLFVMGSCCLLALNTTIVLAIYMYLLNGLCVWIRIAAIQARIHRTTPNFPFRQTSHELEVNFNFILPNTLHASMHSFLSLIKSFLSGEIGKLQEETWTILALLQWFPLITVFSIQKMTSMLFPHHEA